MLGVIMWWMVFSHAEPDNLFTSSSEACAAQLLLTKGTALYRNLTQFSMLEAHNMLHMSDRTLGSWLVRKWKTSTLFGDVTP